MNQTPPPATETAVPKYQSKLFKDIFLKKVQFCSQILDFKDDTENSKEKNKRLNYLNDLSELLNDRNMIVQLIIPCLDHIVEMIEKNIFRPLRVVKKDFAPSEPGMEDKEEVIVDLSWTHRQPVYEFFLQLIVNDAADAKSLKVFITSTFIQKFLELFDSEEPRERQYLIIILHRLYAKLVFRRKMIRKALNDCFYTLIHENYKLNGAAELLDILASIISGFAIPLREEHIHFFKNVIIPLHKVQTYQLYHEQLLRCAMLFLTTDPSLAIPLAEGLLRYWPFGNSAKEVIFLSELLEVLEACDMMAIEPLIPKLFNRLTRCISSPHLQVADRAICFFENDYFLSIVKTYKNQTFPLLVPVICAIADTHWHKMLQESLNALKTILSEIDDNAFQKALSVRDSEYSYLYLVQDVEALKKERVKIDQKWEMITQQVQVKNPDFEVPIVPYMDTHIVGEHNGLNNGNIYL